MASINCNKRRRTAADNLHISDLPIGFIVDVSSYLVKPSRAILAIAFTSPLEHYADPGFSAFRPKEYRLSPITSAIVSATQWDILDFEDIDKELANKLTDDHLYSILKCINARDVLKRLKLCGCINIEGEGLRPLWASLVLEQIDISLVGKHENPLVNPQPKISYEIVPILQSIITRSGSLKYIQFPEKWRGLGRNYPETSELHPILRFREMYMHTPSRHNCTKCSEERRITLYLSEHNFINELVCYDCLDPICGHCMDEHMIGCNICKKKYCTDCASATECVSCSEAYCKGCRDMVDCDECGNASCEDCLNTCDGCSKNECCDCTDIIYCEVCSDKRHCEDCYGSEGCDVKHCDECYLICCSDCRFDKVKEHGNEACRSCVADIAPLLLKENAQLSKEVGELRAKMEGMRCSIL